jgi:hypothetical protein
MLVVHRLEHCYSEQRKEYFEKRRGFMVFTIDSSSLHLIDNFFNFARSLSNSAHNSRFFLDNSTTFVAMASPPIALGPKTEESSLIQANNNHKHLLYL